MGIGYRLRAGGLLLSGPDPAGQARRSTGWSTDLTRRRHRPTPGSTHPPTSWPPSDRPRAPRVDRGRTVGRPGAGDLNSLNALVGLAEEIATADPAGVVAGGGRTGERAAARHAPDERGASRWLVPRAKGLEWDAVFSSGTRGQPAHQPRDQRRTGRHRGGASSPVRRHHQPASTCRCPGAAAAGPVDGRHDDRAASSTRCGPPGCRPHRAAAPMRRRRDGVAAAERS